MPQCVPLAQRTRYPGQAGKRGGWGGTPSAARLLDFWMMMRNFFGVFPLNQGRPGRKSARLAPRRLTCLADGAGEEYLFASSGTQSLLRRRVAGKRFEWEEFASRWQVRPGLRRRVTANRVKNAPRRP